MGIQLEEGGRKSNEIHDGGMKRRLRLKWGWSKDLGCHLFILQWRLTMSVNWQERVCSVIGCMSDE